MEIQPIAHIHSDFSSKFGIPRQAGLVPQLRATIVFVPEYRIPDMLRGIDGFSHLWLIWQFSENLRWSPTVRPPRLGGNTRMGVFATRSPFRPNHLGLSCVELISVHKTDAYGTVLEVGGADLLDGTPIYDIKPYAPYADCYPDAKGGFTDAAEDFLLQVEFPHELLELVAPEHREALIGVLSHDPRPSYQRDPERIYGMTFGHHNVKFQVNETTLTVVSIKNDQEIGD